MKVDMLFSTIKHCQKFTLVEGHGAGVMVGKYMHMEMCVFWGFFCDLISHFFLSLSSLFFCLSLCISYAGPFEPGLIGIDGAALPRYNGKPNIFGPKI